eukprot:TRINITY_DN16625_c0_g1_i1.p3 TRINITY_DN16625_c0_g1~~TRINITY_DN16625_c0_g1_i1.p3  ORF type:complete len:117 (+),score=27.54 TRINITY_DN16625_c0_g1_i1:122-472(+)
MIRRPPRSTQGVSSAASDVYKRQLVKKLNSTISGLQEQINHNERLKLDSATIVQKNAPSLVSTTGNADTTQPSSAATKQEARPRPKCKACGRVIFCLLYTSPSPRDLSTSRMPSSA